MFAEIPVSVFTIYAGKKSFEQTYTAMTKQTFEWFEWIIALDGGISEKEAEAVCRIAGADQRIRVLSPEREKEAGDISRYCHGEYIALLQEGDIPVPGYLEALYWMLHCHQDACGACDSWSVKRQKTTGRSAMFRKAAAVDQQEGEIQETKSSKAVFGDSWLWVQGKYLLQSASRLMQHSEDGMRAVISRRMDVRCFPVKGQQRLCPPYFQEWKCRQDSGDSAGILWLVPWMSMGGSERFNLDAISGLKKAGYQNYVAATVAGGKQWLDKFEACADEVYDLPDFLETEHFLDFVSYLLQTRNIRVLMVSNSYRGYYMLPWLRIHFPELVIVDYVHLEEWYWRNGGYARVSGMLGSVLEKTYVCNSVTKRVLENRFGRLPDSVKTLYIGVDEDRFCRRRFQEGYVHRKLKIEQDRPVVLFPCRIHPQKRPFMLLEIAGEVKKKEPAAAFVVVGDGPQLGKLKAAIKKKKLENTVFCMGYCECMGECYRDASLTLICSLKEGLSLTAYESCAMEVPVISSDVGGQRDLLGDGAGILIPTGQREEKDLDARRFPREEVLQYARAIELLLHNEELYRQIAKKGRQKIETEFSIKRMQKGLEEELTFLLRDSESRERRYQVSGKLKALEGLAEDYYTIERNWEDLQETCGSRLQMVKNGIRALIKKH